MLTVETIGRIRREHFRKGKTIKEIARDLKVSRNTVRKVLRSGETSFEYDRDVQPRPKLGRWTSELDELLASNAAKPSREQLAFFAATPAPAAEAARGHGCHHRIGDGCLRPVHDVGCGGLWLPGCRGERRRLQFMRCGARCAAGGVPPPLQRADRDRESGGILLAWKQA